MDLSKLEEDAARAARDALNVDGTFDVRSPDECSLDDREQSEWDATVRATRAVLAIALAAAAEERWQTIETAPKDGTEILAYRRDAGVFTCLFTSEAKQLGPDYYADDEDRWFTVGGEDINDDMPTHWQPLPAPPRTLATQLGGKTDG